MTFAGCSTVATSTTTGATSSILGTWTVSSGSLPLTIGDLLVAVATVEPTTTAAIPSTVTAGWSQIGSGILSSSRVGISIWTKVCAGPDTAPTFTSAVTGTYSGLHVTLYELAGVTAASVVYGTATGTTANPLTATTSANVTSANSVAIGAHALYTGSNASDTWTKAATFTVGVNTGGSTARYHTASDYLNNPATGAALACAGTWGSAGTYEAAMVVAFPAILSATAVISPGTGIAAAAVPGRARPGMFIPGAAAGPSGTQVQAQVSFPPVTVTVPHGATVTMVSALTVTTSKPAPAIITAETSPGLEVYGFAISGPGLGIP